MTAALRLVHDVHAVIEEHWPTGEPEQQLIGGLMYLDVDQARDVLDLVPDSAICDLIGRWPTNSSAESSRMATKPTPSPSSAPPGAAPLPGVRAPTRP